MKKVLMIALAVLIGVAFVTTAFAQDKKVEKPAAKVEAPAAKVEKPAAKVETKAAPKPKTHQYTGEVTAIDMAAKTLSVKGKKDDKVFDIANVKMKSEPKAGDKVVVTYTEQDGKNIAKTVKITKAAKKDAPKKEEVKKDAVKKDEKPATPATPATPAKK